MKDANKQLEEFIRDFFKRINIDSGLEFKPVSDGKLFVSLTLEDPQIFIGQKGENLISIQSLLNKIIRKNFDLNYYLDLDINNYKRRREEYLKEMAQNAADDVSLTKVEKILPPMTAYERRIIHLELAQRSDIETESRGEEPDRRVVIKPSSKQ